jgi:hypothetical protein
MVTKQIGKHEAIFWVALGMVVCFLGWRIKIGTFSAPGPGFFALIAGLSLIIIGALMLLFKTVSKTDGGAYPAANRATPKSALFKRRLIATMALLVGYAFFLNLLGYLVCTCLVMWGLFYDWGKNRLVNALFASLATTVVTYLIFETWLRTQLPRGIFPWW